MNGWVSPWPSGRWLDDFEAGGPGAGVLSASRSRPLASWFSCCLRFDGLVNFYEQCKSAGIEEKTRGYPRLHPPERQEWGGRMGALIDLDGTLLRLIGTAH